MRGEHFVLGAVFGVQLGSSPHARGALFRRANPSRLKRVIPACAGSTA